MKKNKTEFYIISILAIIIFISSIFFISSSFYNWDVGQFALGIENYDIKMHQPHPPGYPIFIFLASSLNSLLNNSNLSLTIFSLTFSIFAGIFFYLLAFVVTKNRALSVMGTLFFIFNPIFWFYREVGLTYTADALASIVIALCAFKIIFYRDYKYFLIQVAVLGLFAGVRPSIITLLLPLVIFTALYVRGKKYFIFGALILLLGVLIWLVPMAYLSGGFSEYYNITSNLLSVSAEGTSIFAGAPWSATLGQIKTLIGILALALIGVAIPLITALILYLSPKNIYRKLKEKNPRFGLISFTLIFLIWTLPALFIYAFIHLGQPGYILIILPAFYLLAIIGMSYFMEKRWGYLLLVFLLILQTLLFLVLTPYATSPSNLSKAKFYERYLEKINPWFLKFNRTVISDNDEKFELIEKEISEYLDSQNKVLQDTIIIMPRNLFYKENGFELRNDEIFRQIMAYYPEALVVEIAPDRDYWIEGSNYKTIHHYNNIVEIPSERTNIIFIANKIEEKDYPQGIPLKREKQDKIYISELSEESEFDFITFKFKKN